MEPTPERCASLRAHKALPRRRIVSEHDTLRREPKNPSRRASDPYGEITSWIANASPTTSNPNQHLPLTPPSLPHDGPSAPFLDASPDKDETTWRSHYPADRGATPVNQNTPPTPEMTPPRKYVKNPDHHTSDGRRYPSSGSQAESFRTAQEYATSEDGMKDGTLQKAGNNPVTTQQQRSKQETFRTPNEQPKIGLGLDLALDERNSTSTMRTLRAIRNSTPSPNPDETGKFTVEDDPFFVSEAPAVSHMAFEQLTDNSSNLKVQLEEEIHSPRDFQASLDHAFRLQDRLHRKAEIEVEWTGSENQVDVLRTMSNKNRSSSSESLQLDSKRFSQLSAGSSAVVEAVVLDAPRPRKQRLRHSSKNASLRDANSPIIGSNRSSMASSEPKPRLHHNTALFPVNKNRASLNSDSGISMGFEFTNKEFDLQLSEVPKRRSSLKSTPHEKRSSRQVNKDANHHTRSRPTTAPDSADPKPVVANVRSRSISESIPQATVDVRGRELRRSRPLVPPRTSSLSAPTSRNNSRAPSYIPNQPKETVEVGQRQQSVQKSEAPAPRDVPEISIERDDGEEQDHRLTLQPQPSLTRTPFSAISATSFQSSTPGPVEFNEATAISIYPHNNKSVLVVQHSTKWGPDKKRLSARLTNNVTVELRGNPDQVSSTSLEWSKPIDRSQNLNAPLSRPAVLLIPPTPANIYPLDGNHGLGEVQQPKRATSGPLSSIRRALSTRRYSDTAASTPLQNKNQPTFVTLRRRVKLANGSKTLSPFWRPRGFWDDLSDNDGSSDQGYGYVRNTLGLPQRRVTTGPVALARRLGSLKRRKETLATENQQSNRRRSSLPSLRLRSLASFDKHSVSDGAKSRRSLEFDIPFGSFYSSIVQKFSGDEGRKDKKRREKLKKSIGPAMPHGSAFEFQ